MAQKIEPSDAKRKAVSYEEFAKRHEPEVSELFHLGFAKATDTNTLASVLNKRSNLSLSPAMKSFKDHPLVQLLRSAKRENSPDAYRTLLLDALMWAGVYPPAGVLEDRGRPGRPPEAQTRKIFSRWNELDRPPLGQQRFAVAVFGAEFKNGNTEQRKRLKDRCRAAVMRCLKRDEPEP